MQGRNAILGLRSPAARCARAFGPLAAFAVLGLAGSAGGYTPAVDYAVHCQGCHLADGAATPGSVPALAGSVGALARAPGGRAYMVRVPGVAQAPLRDDELAELLNWVVARFGGPEAAAGFPPYTASEVRRLRAEPLVDVDGARRAVLSGAPE